MVKTSVYLDEAQKEELEKVVTLTGRSQADLIRDGIEQIVAQHLRKRPAMTARASGATVLDRTDELMSGFGK
jgi:hypothetical protein